MENRRQTYEHEVVQGNYTIPSPTFTLFMTKDPVANWQGFAKQINSSSYLPNHYNATIDTSHWPHEEAPDKFNTILRQWLGNVTFAA
jgi:soluble epoxide hydrolase/lipid-phosphate phosphatase